MSIHYEDDQVRLFHGDCLEVMRTLPDASVDAVVTDPPYGLEFMGREWDSFKGDAWRNSAGITRTGYTDGGNRIARPSYGGGDSANPTCATCGGRKRGAKKCACPEPDWRVKGKPLDQRQNNAAQMRAFQEWCELWTAECLRVLKPGGHLLAFGGTRTWHRLACAVEDAGFEVRDSIAWMYGSGFPKSLDVSKAIDKAAGAEREVVPNPRAAQQTASRGRGETIHVEGGDFRHLTTITPTPATPDAERWQGWGTALKPAFEPIVVARKPLAGTVAANVLEHGTGALNIDATRIGETVETWPKSRAYPLNSRDMHHNYTDGGSETVATGAVPSGRWPTNVLLDDSQAEALDEQSGESKSPPVGSVANTKGGNTIGTFAHEGRPPSPNGHGDSGGASRFFPTFRYEAKAPKSERPRYKREGGSDNATTYGQMKKRECNVCGNRTCPAGGEQSGKPWPTCGHGDWSWVEQQSARDEYVAHPTVKPLDLCRWLVRLVTPPGGTVLEPFAGSGTTVEACVIEGFKCVAIEKTDEYLPLITQRINRQRDPVAYMQAAGDDLGLFDLEEDTA